MSYAIDRKTITDNLFQGYADPVSSEIPYLPWTQAADLNPYAYDPEKAKALLAEAGWTGDATSTLWYYYPDQLTASVMEAVQQYLAEVGITVELKFDDGGGARQQEFENGTWTLTYGSFGAQPAPANLSIIFGCQMEKTWTYCNPEFDAAMEAALRTYDQEEQATALPDGDQVAQRGLALGLALRPQEPDRRQHQARHRRRGLGARTHPLPQQRPELDSDDVEGPDVTHVASATQQTRHSERSEESQRRDAERESTLRSGALWAMTTYRGRRRRQARHLAR